MSVEVISFLGGDGSSFEKAVQIAGAKSLDSCANAINDFVISDIGEVDFLNCNLLFIYNTTSLKLIADITTKSKVQKKYYFDVSTFTSKEVMYDFINTYFPVIKDIKTLKLKLILREHNEK